MVLEAVLMCLDNSEHMRNGDFRPSRLQAQNEAANVIAQAKTSSNAETVVGALAMAGRRVTVLTTLTRDLGQMMTALSRVQIDGECEFLRSLKTAQLALKNRQNKNQRQRIVLFVGSPLQGEKKEYVKLAKKLKKNSVAVDVVNFGMENGTNDNVDILTAFVEAVDSGDNSHLIQVAPGTPQVLSDVVLSSPICMEGGAAGAAGGMGGMGGMGGAAGGMAQDEDAMLQYALRMSLEESRNAAGGDDAAATGNAAGGDGDDAGGDDDDDEEMDAEEQALLQQALAMSLAMENESGDGDNAAADAAAPAEADAGDGDMDADDLEQLDDPGFIQSLLDSVGVNPDDVELGDLLGDDAEDDKNKDKKGKKKDKDKDQS